MERAYTKESLLPNSSEWHLAEHPSDVPDLLPTQGKSEISDRKVSHFASDKQEEGGDFISSPEDKRRHAEKLGERLNTEIQVISDPKELTSDNAERQERMRRSKGFYDPTTGKVVVVLANNANVEDVAETVLHEVVAHKGLREMLGEDKYDAFCDEVYGHLKDDLKESVDKAATRGFVNEPGRILRAAGFPDMNIELSTTHLSRKAAQRNHEFDIADMRDLPLEIQRPIAVFRYGDKTKSENVIIGLNKDGKQFVVGVHFNQARGETKVSSIRGLFPKDNAEWLNWISQGKAEWLDKAKIQTLKDQQRTNLADVEYLDLDYVAKVINSFENPKIPEGEKKEYRFRDGETGDIWKDHSVGLEEGVAEGDVLLQASRLPFYVFLGIVLTVELPEGDYARFPS